MIMYMLDLLFYIVYLSLQTPGKKQWISRKESARNSFVMLMILYCWLPITIILFCLYYYFHYFNFEKLLFIWLGCSLIQSITLWIILYKRYTYSRMESINNRYNGRIKRWQARIMYYLLLTLQL